MTSIFPVACRMSLSPQRCLRTTNATHGSFFDGRGEFFAVGLAISPRGPENPQSISEVRFYFMREDGRMRRCLLLIPALGLLLGATPTQEKDKDLERFQGAWKITEQEFQGKSMKDEMAKLPDMILTTMGNKYVINIGKKKFDNGTLKFDSSKTPKELDVLSESGPLKGKVLRGIYELTNDKMRACFGPADGERPGEFDTKKGKGRVMIRYERVKK
jgi:uncharacterized protein (TIGR03067 family)